MPSWGCICQCHIDPNRAQLINYCTKSLGDFHIKYALFSLNLISTIYALILHLDMPANLRCNPVNKDI